MAIATALSRITGVLRIFALAYALGTGPLADMYNLANTIPNVIHDVVLGGVLSATFVPVFVQRLANRSEEDAWEAISAVVTITLVVIAVASVVFLLAAPLIVDALTIFDKGPGVALQRSVAVGLLRLFVPQLACYGIASLATALLNSRQRFGAPMVTPIANNLVLIGILLWYATVVNHATLAGVQAHRSQLLLLGVGTTLGVVVQALLLLPSLRRANLHLRWVFALRHEAVRTIFRLSGWTLGLVLTNQLALVVVLAFAGKVGAGTISAYTYAYTFFQLPYGVVAVSIMSAATPDLAARWSGGDRSGFRRRFTVGIRAMLAIVIPAAAGELVLARPGVALVLAHHAASASGTLPTAQALAMMTLGIPGFCVFLYAARALQAMQDLRTAFWLYVLENGVNIVAVALLAGPLGVRGIALSISIAYSVAAVVALVVLGRRLGGLTTGLVAWPILRVLVATVGLVVAADLASNLSGAESFLALLVRVILGAVTGLVAYFAVAVFLAAIRSGRTRTPRGRHASRGRLGR
jgi:putative peptidoglycan lipid II flippase